MIICLCNDIRTRDVEDAALKGCGRPCEIFSHYGCQPCCGRCSPEMTHILRGYHTASLDTGDVSAITP